MGTRYGDAVYIDPHIPPKQWEKTTASTDQPVQTMKHQRIAKGAGGKGPHPKASKIVKNQSRFLGRGCDEALFSEKRGLSEKGGGNSVNEGFGKDFYRKAIQ